MSSYKKTVLSRVPIPTNIHPELPFILDDFSLALHLGVRCRTVWYCVAQKRRLYRRFTIPKANGKKRVILNPHNILKFVQRRIDAMLLKPMPLLDCVGAYVTGRSCLHSAERHVGHKVRIGMDLKDFFPTHNRAWVRQFFKRHTGYSHFVSGLLADLCTAQQRIAPHHSIDQFGERKPAEEVRWRHFIPQGSPASPSLCNLIAQEWLDRNVLQALKGSGWVYTRYSDDLTLSHPGDQSRQAVDDLLKLMQTEIKQAGYRTNMRKLKVQRHYRRQKMLGIVVNDHPNIPRDQYRRYRAIIHNCLHHGFQVNALRFGWDPPETFLAHLRGKLSYFHSVNPERTVSLRKMLAAAEARHGTEDWYSGDDIVE
jgi:hypothetical protein